MITKFRLLLATGCLAVALHSCMAGEVLRWKFAEGQQLAVEVAHSTETATEVNGKTIRMTMQMTMAMDWTVEAVDDAGTAKLNQVFTRLSIKANLPGTGDLAFDSAQDGEPSEKVRDIAAAVTPLLGQKINVRMTELGEIQDITLSQDAIDALEGPAAKIKNFGSTGETFSAETITKALKQSSLLLPRESVEVGTKWNRNSESRTPLGAVKQATEYKYVGLDEKTQNHKIEVTTKLDLVPNAEKHKLTAHESTGSMLFDNDAGRLVQVELSQKLVNESQYRETKIVVTTTGTVRTTIKAKTP